MQRPTLHVIAGPNGAGKTTFHELQLSRLTGAEFVNADRLAEARFGHPAATEAESRHGQDAAEARRAALMERRASLVVETTFSHPSKLDLVRRARALGYRVVVYHLSVRDPELSVARVAFRTRHGGHPVPEDRIRARYARNGALIRQAVLEADHGYVFDTSLRGRPPVLLATFRTGRGRRAAAEAPAWFEALYGPDLGGDP